MSRIDCSAYSIYVNEDWDQLVKFIDDLRPSKTVVIADQNTETYCLPIVLNHLGKDLDYTTIPPGESHKNIETCQKLWKDMMEMSIDRNALVLNLGGGVIGDMGGFAASTFMRGVNFIQIPTTLLSMVDASIGGKLGIDFKHYKNLVGSFADPKMVWIDSGFLKTLDSRQIKSGFAETIKHALIQSGSLWNKITTLDLTEVIYSPEIIESSILIKKEVVDRDPFESGLRKILNFGHTIGHAFESLFLNDKGKLLHGEAIVIGMICESFISFKKSMISQSNLQNITSFLVSIYGTFNQDYDREELSMIIKFDKKNIQGNKMFSLIDGLGSCTYNVGVEDSLIFESLKYYDSLR